MRIQTLLSRACSMVHTRSCYRMTGYQTKQNVPAVLNMVSFIQKIPFRIVALLIFCCSSHIGCSSGSNSPQLERISREDVILEEVRGHPTEFTIALGDQMLVWRRLYLLGTQYLNTDTPQTILAPPTAKGFHLKHAPSHLKNTPMDLPYEVIAKPTDTGELQVQVRTAESRNGPMLIARNIARFLQTGTLERSLFPDRQL